MLITVFTPTYNRAHLLPRLYESLCRQTFRDFEWVIVDDGSVDDTKSLSLTLPHREGTFFPIRYLYQKNGGKHRAINRGVRKAHGELFFIADSDDWLPDDALEIVAKYYDTIKYDGTFAGVAGFDMNPDGRLIGQGTQQFEVLDCSPVDFWCKYHVRGDMKEVFRTNILRKYRFPEYEGEKFCPEELVWIRISKNYKLRYFNEVIYVAEYRPDGLSARLVQLRMDNPYTAMLDCKEYIEFGVPLRKAIKNSINYWRWFYCLPLNTRKYPTISKKWYVTKPIGKLMHMHDLRRR